MSYGTRSLQAGDEFETENDAHGPFLKAIGYAEEVTGETSQPSLRRRAKVVTKKTAVKTEQPTPEPEPETQQAEPEPVLEDKTVHQLREIAEEKGVELPPGYVRKDDLIDKIEEVDQDNGDDGRF